VQPIYVSFSLHEGSLADVRQWMAKGKRESADLSRLYVRSSAGRLVPLSAVAHFKSQVGPLTVQHLGQLPAVTLSFDLAKGTSLSDVVPVIERAAKAWPR
jgi:multidrug efflux pump subunit AcrB